MIYRVRVTFGTHSGLEVSDLRDKCGGSDALRSKGA